MKLTENFTLEELTHSDIADREKLQNIPDDEIISNLKALCENVLQPIRNELGAVITVTSGFRSFRINALAKGSRNSQHLTGQAADIKCFAFGNKVLFDSIKKNVKFDQLIWEYGDNENPAWVHVSFRKDGKNRQQVIKIS
jgi:hypothetical protein